MQIVFWVCSIVQGANCHSLPPMALQEGVGLIGCAIAGQMEGVKYRESHPNYYISRYTCEPFGKYTRM
jgi:hypothetical protein